MVLDELSFSDIRLSVMESITLRRAQRNPIRKNNCFDRLQRLDLVTEDWGAQILDGPSFSDNNTMVSTDFGSDYLHYRRGRFWPEFRNWASLIIATAAFIKSFFF